MCPNPNAVPSTPLSQLSRTDRQSNSAGSVDTINTLLRESLLMVSPHNPCNLVVVVATSSFLSSRRVGVYTVLASALPDEDAMHFFLVTTVIRIVALGKRAGKDTQSDTRRVDEELSMSDGGGLWLGCYKDNSALWWWIALH